MNGPPPIGPTKAYWALQLNQHAVNLSLAAPYDTVQLTATPFNAVGTPLAEIGQVTYTAVDSTVTVSPTGLVTAHYVTNGNGTQIIASLQDQSQRVTHVDTVDIQVTPTAPPLPFKDFSLQPVSGDSAKRCFGCSNSTNGYVFPHPVTIIDAMGDTLCNATACVLQVAYTSSNPTVATIDPHTGQVTKNDTGRVVFTATAIAYGKMLRDSVTLTIGLSLGTQILFSFDTTKKTTTLSFDVPPHLLFGIGAVITFWNRTDKPVDIVFNQPASIDTASSIFEYQQFTPDSSDINDINDTIPPTGRGNISAFGGDTSQSDPFIYNPNNTCCHNLRDFASRRFSIPGVYQYHSSLFPSATYEIEIRKETY